MLLSSKCTKSKHQISFGIFLIIFVVIFPFNYPCKQYFRNWFFEKWRLMQFISFFLLFVLIQECFYQLQSNLLFCVLLCQHAHRCNPALIMLCKHVQGREFSSTSPWAFCTAACQQFLPQRLKQMPPQRSFRETKQDFPWRYGR